MISNSAVIFCAVRMFSDFPQIFQGFEIIMFETSEYVRDAVCEH